jgi:hypothetical protein
MEATMTAQYADPSDAAIEQAARKFLREHPEAKEALDLFGIAEDQYERFLAAQQPVYFYTSASTTEGGPHGELD